MTIPRKVMTLPCVGPLVPPTLHMFLALSSKTFHTPLNLAVPKRESDPNNEFAFFTSLHQNTYTRASATGVKIWE